MKTFRFYKETSNRWYIDLPDWTGSKDDLEMVAGADAMLEYMAEGKNEVSVIVSETDFKGADVLNFVRMADEIGNGAYYHFNSFKGVKIGLDMWLCDVVLFVFNNVFPKQLFLSVAVTV